MAQPVDPDRNPAFRMSAGLNEVAMKFECAMYSERGVDKKRNEDALLVGSVVRQGTLGATVPLVGVPGDRILAIAVADGLAGSRMAHAGSHLLLNLLAQAVARMDDFPVLPTLVAELQERFVEQARKLGCTGTAATLAGCLVRQDAVLAFNVGDSRVYASRSGKFRRLSQDHTELADMIADGSLEEMAREDAPSSFLEPSAYFVADALHETPRVHGATIRIEPGDRLLVTTDGLVDFVNDEEIGKADYCGLPGLRKLARLARTRGATDDVTMIGVSSR